MQWRPDLVWFNNHASWGSAHYEVQKLFMNNTGDRVVPSTATTTPDVSGPLTGAVGLSTWATSAACDDVRVTAADGTPLFGDDFSGDAARWTHTGGGSWSVRDGAYVQSDTTADKSCEQKGRPARDARHARSRRCRKALVAPLQGPSGALRSHAPDAAS